MADSGARGSTQQIRQLAAMRGLMAKPSGEIIETPITANFREGLTVLQYFISTHGARKGLADTALKTANSGYLTRRLVDVAQDAVISEFDCGTLDGIRVTKLEDAGEVIQPLGDRILGRVTLEDTVDPLTGEVLVAANTELDEALVMKIEDAGIEEVVIRSVLTCADATRRLRQVLRTRPRPRLQRQHRRSGGHHRQRSRSASRAPSSRCVRSTSVERPRAARSSRARSRSATKASCAFAARTSPARRTAPSVVMNRHGELVDRGRDRSRARASPPRVRRRSQAWPKATRSSRASSSPSGTRSRCRSSPRSRAVVKFGDLVEGVTMIEKLDEVTGLSRKVVIESRAADLRPRISIKDPKTGETIKLPNSTLEARYLLPVGANIVAQDGDLIEAGEVLSKIPRETTKTQDITGGLPRVAELFEARKPKDHAIIAEIDGEVSFGKDTKGKRKVVITPFAPDGTQLPDQAREYLIPKGKHIQVQPGDRMRAGEPLMDGPANPHDILRVKGEKELAAYLVNEIQQVYRLQGVAINDKHIEVIVRQMMRRVRIKDVGDTNFLIDEQIEKHIFERENQKVIERGGRPAIAEPLLLGITKASLSTESFISASSFQETTKVLTEAAICGKTDHLRGLKENVIMGRLIPAGTGLPAYKSLRVIVEGDDERPARVPAPPAAELSAVNEE